MEWRSLQVQYQVLHLTPEYEMMPLSCLESQISIEPRPNTNAGRYDA